MTFETWWIEEAERDERAIYLARSAWDAGVKAAEEEHERIVLMQLERIEQLEENIEWHKRRATAWKDLNGKNGYVPMPIEPSPAMIQAMVWWCPELSLSTGDLVEFYQDMIKAEHDKEQE